MAVNAFRKAMTGRDEQLSNGGNDGKNRSLLVVSRGEAAPESILVIW